MNESQTNDPFAGLPADLPSEHRANLERLEMRSGRRLASSVRPSVLTPVRGVLVKQRVEHTTEADATDDEFLFRGDISFRPTTLPADQPPRQWQPIGTLSLGKAVASGDEWIDLLCVARRGSKYLMLPVLMEDAVPEIGQEESDRVNLVLEPAGGLQVTAKDLQRALDEALVVGAYTKSSLGVFVALTFDLPDDPAPG